jgi:hypothetical protein
MRGPGTASTLLLALLLAAASARAQLAGGHGLLAPPRSLHERLASAGAVAVGVIDTVETGRVNVRDAVALRGDVPEAFQIKRSPSRPPQLSPGRAALLLLGGARPPYLLLDDPRELATFAPEERAAWQDAVRRLLAAGDDPSAQLATYLDWVDGGPEGLRSLALIALADRGAGFQPLPARAARGRARAALDPSRPADERRSNAWIAVATPDGTAALLAGVPGEPAVADAAVVGIALEAGAGFHSPQGAAAFLRVLHSPDAAMRRAAIRLARIYASDPAVRSELERAAASEQDARLRQQLEAALAPQRGAREKGSGQDG